MDRVKSIRVACLWLAVGSVVVAAPAYAQGRPAAPPSVSARMDALEARVAKLESGAVVEADIVGSYAATIFAMDLQSQPKVQTETATGTFTLAADHTVSFTGSGAHCALEQTATWFVGCDPGETGDFTGTGTWAIGGDGSLQILHSSGDPMINDPNFIGAGGRVIISGGTGASATEIYSLIMILVKLPPAPLPPTP